MPFSEFFKHYRKEKMGGSGDEIEQASTGEDFNIEDLVNVNEISDDDLEAADELEDDKSDFEFDDLINSNFVEGGEDEEAGEE